MINQVVAIVVVRIFIIVTQTELTKNPINPSSSLNNDSSQKNQAEFNQKRLTQIQRLTDILKKFEAFKDSEQGKELEDLRLQSIHIAEHKLIPELKYQNQLPLLICLVGGTNTGKSTFFNALVGMVLSEARINAGATKHPLIYAHEAYRQQICSDEIFSNLTIQKLQSSGELLVPQSKPHLYYQLHDREELRDYALIDCPDFDSVAKENQLSAKRIVEQSDLCIFLTTPQKYKDRLLVNELAWLLDQRKSVFVLFNLTDDQMLYRTMLEDLKQQLPSENRLFYGAYLPTLKDSQPERILETQVWTSVNDFFKTKPKAALKKEQLDLGIALLLKTTEKMVHEYQKQTDFKDELLNALQVNLKDAIDRYQRDFQLSFPEIIISLDQQLAQLELYHLFSPVSATAPSSLNVVAQQVLGGNQSAPQIKSMLYNLFGLVGPKIRAFLIAQFDLGQLPSDWDKFCVERDERDLLSIRSSAQFMRTGIEQVLRLNTTKSAMAQLLIEKYYNAQQLQEIELKIIEKFKSLQQSQKSVSEEVLAQAKLFNQKSGSFLRKFSNWLSNGVKFLMALIFAYYSDGFGFWDLFIFGPLGFLLTAYGICWLLYLNLKRKSNAFKAQRIGFAEQIFIELQVNPIKNMVDQLVNQSQLTELMKAAEELSQSTEENK